MVVEVMGRHSGWIATYAGIAGGATVVLIPEIPFDIDEVCQRLIRRHERGRLRLDRRRRRGRRAGAGHARRRREAGYDKFGHVRLGGIADLIAREIGERTGFETRVVMLGHVQRGGTPTAFDRVLSTRFGVAAIDLVHDGRWGQMVVARGQRHRAGAARRSPSASAARRPGALPGRRRGLLRLDAPASSSCDALRADIVVDRMAGRACVARGSRGWQVRAVGLRRRHRRVRRLGDSASRVVVDRQRRCCSSPRRRATAGLAVDVQAHLAHAVELAGREDDLGDGELQPRRRQVEDLLGDVDGQRAAATGGAECSSRSSRQRGARPASSSSSLGPRSAPRSSGSAASARRRAAPSAAAGRRRRLVDEEDPARPAASPASAARRFEQRRGRRRDVARRGVGLDRARRRRDERRRRHERATACQLTPASLGSLGDRPATARSAGSSMTKRAPGSPSSRSSTHTRPPCMRTCSSTRARPSPAPSLPLRRPARDAAGEALEDQRPLLDRHAGAVVLDGDLHVGQRLVRQVGVGDRDLGLAAAVGAGVVDQVGDARGPGAGGRRGSRPARPVGVP